MRALLKILAMFGLMLGLYYIHHYSDMRLVRKDSAVFVADAANAIASHWDAREFAKYADSSALNGKDVESVFASYRALGKLTRPVTCEIQDFTSYKYPNNVLFVSATYQCDAQFEKAPATLQLAVYRFTDKVTWKIQSFSLYSSFFSSQAPARPVAAKAAAPKASGAR